jgi:hypothetical protein
MYAAGRVCVAVVAPEELCETRWLGKCERLAGPGNLTETLIQVLEAERN